MSSSFLSKIKKFLSPAAGNTGPRIIARSKHNITRANINGNALKVLYRLKQQGFEAYLVGGGVRDLLLGLHPKDFDVATNATPDQVRDIFHNCRLIGRRFRLAHVVFGREIIEVATFRGQAQTHDDPNHAQSSDGMIMRDNVYGSMEEDAWRRDFTINALYYNIKDYSVVDFTGGLDDLRQRKLRMIGDPLVRFREDPVRILRAVRFAAKLDLNIDKSLQKPIAKLKHLIANIPQARLYDEMLKLFHSGAGVKALNALKSFQLLDCLLGDAVKQYYEHPGAHAFLIEVLKSTDERVSVQKPIQPAFVLAALLWQPTCGLTQKYVQKGMPLFPARMRALEESLSLLLKQLSIPKRVVHAAREIIQFQMRLERRDGKRAFAMLGESRFRAAYDFLVLRAQAGEPVTELSTWWTTFIDADNHSKKQMVQGVGQQKGGKSRRRRRSPRPKNRAAT